MEFLAGYPIFDKSTGTYGVVESVRNNYVIYVYNKDKFFFKNSCDIDNCTITNTAYLYIPVSIRILNIEESMSEFGNKQKYKDFINSVLPIQSLNKNNGYYYFVLQTLRKNGDLINIISNDDIEVIFPTIITPEKIESILKIREGSYVKLKSKSKKYDLYKDKILFVKNIYLINNFSDMNILELEDDNNNHIMEQQKYVIPWDTK